MKPSIYLVAADLPGKLFIMPKPSGEWLKEDVDHYRSIGVDVIISLLEPDEVSELSLGEQSEICAENKIAFTQFPIVDRGLPELEPFKKLVLTAISDLKNGKNVAVHCRAGIGRSGITVCGALLGFGYSPEIAMKMTSDARGVKVPDTEGQRDFIGTMATELNI